MNMNREEVMNKETISTCWPETISHNNPTRRTNRIMANENVTKDVFDIDFELPPEKGKACHMQVDEDLHRFLKRTHTSLGVTFRKFANELLCKGIQQYIKAKKLDVQ